MTKFVDNLDQPITRQDVVDSVQLLSRRLRAMYRGDMLIVGAIHEHLTGVMIGTREPDDPRLSAELLPTAES